MKIRLENPAVNISNFMNDKNEKVRRGLCIKKFDLIYVFLQGTMNGNQNNGICNMLTRGFLTEILLHRNHAVDRNNLSFFIYFYYSQILRTFTQSFYCFIIHIQTSFLTIMMSQL